MDKTMPKKKLSPQLKIYFVVLFQEEKYKELYEKEVSSHKETQLQMEKVTTQLAETKMEINIMALDHQKQIDNMKRKVRCTPVVPEFLIWRDSMVIQIKPPSQI